jgi:hypothetical protein
MTQVEHKCHMNLFEAPLSLSFYTILVLSIHRYLYVKTISKNKYRMDKYNKVT